MTVPDPNQDATPTPALVAATTKASPRRLWTDILHVFVLWGFAVAQPLYDRLGKQSVFLLDQNITPTTIGMLIVLSAIVLPGLIVIVEFLLARHSRRAEDVAHSLIVFVLLLCLALPLFGQFAVLPAPVVLSLALVVTSLVCWSYFRIQQVRTLVTCASIGLLVFPAVFWRDYCAATAMITSSASRSERYAPTPVVVVVFDEFCGQTLMTPDRQIDERRFPNFATLAKRATWFRNAASVHHLTTYALPAILSGKYSRTPMTPRPVDLPQNLFTVLTAAGEYEVVAFEPISILGRFHVTESGRRPTDTFQQLQLLADVLSRVYLSHLSPADLKATMPVVPRKWFGWHDSTAVDRNERRGRFAYGWSDQRDDQFQHFLDCMDDSPNPALYFGHFLLPHIPWSYLPSGRRYSVDGPEWDYLCLPEEMPDREKQELDELIVIKNQQRYLLQLMYVDRLIGQLKSRLIETGLWDRCLLIVTADHGASYRVNELRRGLTSGNLDEIISVPLFVKRPNQNVGEISDRPVEAVDILPTIADVVGLELLAPTDGWSVYDAQRPPRTRFTVGEFPTDTYVDVARLLESRAPSEIAERFGDSADPEAIYAIGPMPELVGRAVNGLKITRGTLAKVHLIRYGDQVADGPNAIIPSYFEGTVTPPQATSEPVVVAVAINGTIRAVTRTFRQPGIVKQWAAVVPEHSFHPGNNDVQFFIVNGPDRRLIPCAMTVADNVKTNH